jgi:four helix bundle protein
VKSENQNRALPTDLRERSFTFALRILNLCRSLDAETSAARTISKQLLRSGTSIGANIEEAHGSQSRADFTAKLSIACKEARETHYWLRLLTASELVAAPRLQALTDEANQLIAILTTIVKKCRRPVE